MSYLDFVSKQIEESVQYMSSPIRNTNCKLGVVSGDTLIVSTGVCVNRGDFLNVMTRMLMNAPISSLLQSAVPHPVLQPPLVTWGFSSAFQYSFTAFR